MAENMQRPDLQQVQQPVQSMPQQRMFSKMGIIIAVAIFIIQFGVIVLLLVIPSTPASSQNPITSDTTYVEVCSDDIYRHYGVDPNLQRVTISYEVQAEVTPKLAPVLKEAISRDRFVIQEQIERFVFQMDINDILDRNLSVLKEQVKKLLNDRLGEAGEVKDVYFHWKPMK